MLDLISELEAIGQALSEIEEIPGFIVTFDPERAAPALAARMSVLLVQVAPEIEFINLNKFNATWTAWLIEGNHRNPLEAQKTLMPLLQAVQQALGLESATPATYEHPSGLMPALELKFTTANY